MLRMNMQVFVGEIFSPQWAQVFHEVGWRARYKLFYARFSTNQFQMFFLSRKRMRSHLLLR